MCFRFCCNFNLTLQIARIFIDTTIGFADIKDNPLVWQSFCEDSQKPKLIEHMLLFLNKNIKNQ
jgi:hypothetical protein